MMENFHATVRGGRLTLDEPTELPEGTLVELVVDFFPELTAEEQAWLKRDLDASTADEEAGRLIDAHDAMAELRLLQQGQERSRGYIERLLGWDDEPAVKYALNAVYLAATHQAALVLCGDGDLVQVALDLHRRMLGSERPFVLCGPHRRATDAGVPLANYRTGMAALEAAARGSVCMWSKRLPRDFAALAAVLRTRGANTQLILCGSRLPDRTELALAPIQIPALSRRQGDLDRIIDECAHEVELALEIPGQFTDADRDWMRTYSATSLHEIEKGVWRKLALRKTGSLARAAALLGMSHTSLGEWFKHRRAQPLVRQRRREEAALAQTRQILRSARESRQKPDPPEPGPPDLGPPEPGPPEPGPPEPGPPEPGPPEPGPPEPPTE